MLLGKSHGSRIHLVSASSYTSADVVSSPPVTMMHLASAATRWSDAHARQLCPRPCRTRLSTSRWTPPPPKRVKPTPVQAVLPSGSRTAIKSLRLVMRGGCGVHAPGARPTWCTVDKAAPSSSQPPSRSTCLAALPLSSTAIAEASAIPPHDNDGRLVNTGLRPLLIVLPISR
jgi:hypothetical protein